MTRPHTVRQSDVTLAIKGALSAGMDIGQVEIDPITGRIVISPPGPYDNRPPRRKKNNDWDVDSNEASL